MAYGYVRDDAPTQVDWNKVGNDMTKILEDEVTDRENRKASIDKIDADFALSLLDQPQGANAETNRFMADLSKDAGTQMAKDIDDLRNGRLSERDYYKKRANTTQGVDIMFKAGKSFNANFDKAMKRANDGTSSSREIFLREQMEGFLKFSKSGAYINPLTGEINVAERTKNDDGTFSLSTTPGSFANASELLRLSTQEYDKFDVQGNITGVIENLGTIMVKDKMGVTTEMAFNNLYDDKKSVALMNDAKVNLIESILANDNQKSSILSDRMGYDFTYDEEKAKKDSKLLLMLPDGSIKFTEAQDKEATAYVESLFEAGLDKKITDRQQLTEPEKDRSAIEWAKLKQRRKEFNKGDEDKEIELNEEAEVVSILYSGTPEQIVSSLDYFRDYKGTNDVKYVKRNENGISLIVGDGDGGTITKTISFYAEVDNPDYDPNKPDAKGNEKRIKKLKTENGVSFYAEVDNPDYDPTKPEVKSNEKRIKKLKSEAEFLLSAGQALTGKNYNSVLDDPLYSKSGFNRPLTIDETRFSETKYTPGEVNPGKGTAGEVKVDTNGVEIK